MVLGKDGEVFAVLDDATTAPDRSIAVIDGKTGVVDALVTGDFGALAVYDRRHDQLITGDPTALSGTLRRHLFDAAKKTLTLAEARKDAGQDCRDLAISGDGKHLVYLCAGGASGIDDLRPDDLSVVQGTWDAPLFPTLQTFPRGAVFGADGAQLVVSTAAMYVYFDVASHTAIQGTEAGGTCWSSRGVRMSPFGEEVYLLDDCENLNVGDQTIRSDWLVTGL